MAVPDGSFVLETQHAVDLAARHGKRDGLRGGDPGIRLADEGKEALPLALEEELDRTVGVHEGPLPFRESKGSSHDPRPRQVREAGFPLQTCITRAGATTRDALTDPGPAQIVAEGAGWLTVDAEGPGWLVTTQPWYPGWTAEIDSRPVFDAADGQPVSGYQPARRGGQRMRHHDLCCSGFSALGLVEVTRKRTRESLAHILCEPCPACSGKGQVKTARTICYEILRELLREAKQFNPREFRIIASQIVVDMFLEEESQHLAMLGDFIGKPISLQVENVFHQEQYDIILM